MRLQYVVAARVVLVDDGVGAVNERRLITAKLKGAHQIGVRYEAYVARWQVTAAVAAAAAADDAVDAVADVAADALCRVHQWGDILHQGQLCRLNRAVVCQAVFI